MSWNHFGEARRLLYRICWTKISLIKKSRWVLTMSINNPVRDQQFTPNFFFLFSFQWIQSLTLVSKTLVTNVTISDYHREPPGELWKHRLLDPMLRVSDSVNSCWDWKVHISDRLKSAAAAASLGVIHESRGAVCVLFSILFLAFLNFPRLIDYSKSAVLFIWI